MIRGIFLLLGVGILIPWNAFVSAKSYYTARFCQDGEDIINFEQWFGLMWNGMSVLSLGLIIASQSFFDYWSKKNKDNLPTNASDLNNSTIDSTQSIDSFNGPRSENILSSDDQTNNSSFTKSKSFYKVMIPLGLYTLVFLIQALLVTIPDISTTNFLIVTLISLALCGTCGAIATSGIIATASKFPSHIGVNPFFSGQALGGAAVAIANFATIAIGENPHDFLEEHCGNMTNQTEEAFQGSRLSMTSVATTRLLENTHGKSCSSYQNLDLAVLLYFLAGVGVLLFCLVGFHKVHQYQLTRHRHVYETVHSHHSDQHEIDDGTDDNSPRIGLELNDRIQQRQQLQSLDDETRENQTEELDVFDDEREDYINSQCPTPILSVTKGPATCIFLTFTITLALFPSWVSELKSSHECENEYRLDNDLYVPFSFVFFNIGDLLGRLISGYIPINRIHHLSRKLVVSAILRVLFLPLFFMCNTTIGSESSLVIRNDFFSLMVQFLFAVSNGVLVSTSFMWSPQLVGTDATLQDRAGEIMTFSLSFGLLTGSLLAFPLVQFATHLLQR